MSRLDLRLVRISGPLLVAGLIGGLALASGAALTVTSAWLIVRASERPVILTLLTAVVAVRTFGIARPVLRYWERLRTHDAALADLARRRVDAYAGLIPLTPARLGRRGRADLLTGVVEDLDDVVGAQIRVTVPGLSALVAWGLTTLLAALVDLRVGGWLALLGLVVLLLAVAGYRLEVAGNTALGAARARVTSIAALLTGSATEIAAVGGGPEMLAELDEAQRIWWSTALRQARGRALVAATILLAVGAGAFAIGLTLARGGGHSPAVTALLALTPIAVADALTPLAEASRSLARARGSATRLHEVLTQQPAVAAAAAGAGRQDAAPEDLGSEDREVSMQPMPPAAGDAVLEEVTGRWTPERPVALGPIDLDVPAGTHLAVTGANGSGKSTLLAVLARQLDPESGRYRLHGDDVLALPLDDARAAFAIVEDAPHVFASTLRENLRLAAPGADDGALVEALTKAGLAQWFSALPDGLDTRLGVDGRGMSGGEQARLAVARALASKRPAVLLDEPVAHLDSATAREVLADLLAAGEGRTVVMVSHRDDGREGFDRVLELKRPGPS